MEDAGAGGTYHAPAHEFEPVGPSRGRAANSVASIGWSVAWGRGLAIVAPPGRERIVLDIPEYVAIRPHETIVEWDAGGGPASPGVRGAPGTVWRWAGGASCLRRSRPV